MSLRRPLALLSCFIATVAIIFAFSIKQRRAIRNESFQDTPRVELQASYTARHDVTFERIFFPPHPPREADTTAIILNWSRLPNVVRIVEQLCDQSLQYTIATILVWNNSPRALSQEDFRNVPDYCAKKLQTHNSPVNLYFEARYIACAQATTSYCFIQDDDYLIWPEIINTLRHQIAHSTRPRIHLLPPHELLSSRIREIYTDSGIHTSFAWLGYGTIIRRSEVTAFVDLMKSVNVTKEELRMSDNYFTILSNTYSELWFDHGVELGGGQPFTVGAEGDKRNNHYIIKATQLLQSITPKGSSNTSRNSRYPYIRTEDTSLEFPTYISRAPCLGSNCLFETSISTLPDGINHFALTADQMLSLGVSNMELLSDKQILHYHTFPPSYAVDGRPDTAFRSLEYARQGDMISLDVMEGIGLCWKRVEFVFLVDLSTETILRASTYQMGVGEHWTMASSTLVCADSDIRSGSSEIVRECAIQMLPAPHVWAEPHIFKASLDKDVEENWCIYEVWIRGSITK